MTRRADRSRRFPGALLAACLATALLAPRAAAQAAVMPAVFRSAVLHDGQLIVLREDGRLRVWDAETGKRAGEAPMLAPPQPARAIASDGRTLWFASRSAAWSWSPATHAWIAADDFDAHGEDVLGLALVGGAPLVVLGSSVLSLADGRSFPVPPANVQSASLRPLAIRALHVGGASLWIGTDNGEWGGELLHLNVCAGSWDQCFDALGDVTGITQSASDGVIVSWAMNHLSHRNTILRVHAADVTVNSATRELEDKYVQVIAWNVFDETLYGVESGSLVRFVDDKPLKILDLDADLPPSQRKPDRAPPRVVALLPKARRSLFIVTAGDWPKRWNQGSLERLEDSSHDAAAAAPPR